MSTAGPNNPSSSAGSNWTNPDRAYASDDSWTTTTLNGNLLLTGYGFSIPVGSTIDGVTVRIERHSDQNSKFIFSTDSIVQLIIGGSATGSNKAAVGVKWPTSDATASYGGVADKWGLTPTVAQVNGTDFGVFLQGGGGGTGAIGSVDVITITITYTAAASAPIGAYANTTHFVEGD